MHRRLTPSRSRMLAFIGIFAVLCGAVVVLPPELVIQTARSNARPIHTPTTGRLPSNYGSLPLTFEPNVGQSPTGISFLVHGTSYAAAFDSAGLALTFSGRSRAASSGVGLKFLGTGSGIIPVGIQRMPGTVNYFVGSDPSKWRVGVPTFARLEYPAVWPGVNVDFYGTGSGLEYDFVVAPGADPTKIKFDFSGARSLRLGTSGNINIGLGSGTLSQLRPVAYQVLDGNRVLVPAGYVVDPSGGVTLKLGTYNGAAQLVIDPALVYATYLGGSGWDYPLGIAVDAAGSAYVTGYTNSPDFPNNGGAYTADQGGYDAFVTKLNPTGTAAVYSTYLGGSGDDYGNSIAVDSSGDAVIAGQTFSSNFPITPGALQSAQGGAFVAKLSPSGSSLMYATYLGGLNDFADGIGIDSAGDAYAVGGTSSASFPTTPGAFQTMFAGGGLDLFVSKVNPTGTALIYSTYIGGTGSDYPFGIAVDSAGSAYVTGSTESHDYPTTANAFQRSYTVTVQDGFVTKLDPTGSTLAYSTYLGGSGADNYGESIAVDASGDAFVTGATDDATFPTTPGAFQATYQGGQDGFVTKVNPTGTGLIYSTYLGGTGSDLPFGIAVDSSGEAYVTGSTQSANFPTTADAFQTTYSGGTQDGFVSRLDPGGTTLSYSTYLAGAGADNWGQSIAVDGAGDAFIAGGTDVATFPSTPGAFQGTYHGGGNDGFVAEIANITSGVVTSSGGTVSTGSSPSASQPLVTSVTVPPGTTGGTVTIAQGPVTGTPPSGYSFLGEQVNISAPSSTASNPLQIVFTMEPSLVHNQGLSAVQIFRNGVQLPDCPGSSIASPDPCLSGRVSVGGNYKFTVLTSSASTWNFGALTSSPPVVGSITVPAAPQALGTTVSASASFVDSPNVGALAAVWTWGDGTTSPGTLSGASTSGTVTGSHAYAAAGVYTVSVTVTNAAGQSGSAIAATFVVIYDPTGGFVTGGGWINSPAGAYISNPSLTGRANFGFNSKYQKGASIPSGNTEFHFQAGSLDFKSDAYDWLVIAGAKAQYKGTGSVNRVSGYSFLLTACDIEVNGSCSGSSSDTFRIKIWNTATGTIVYDNAPGSDDLNSNTEALGGGDIVIHKS